MCAHICIHAQPKTTLAAILQTLLSFFFFFNEMWSITSMEVAKQTGLARQCTPGPSYLHFPRARIINVYHHG